ncbi:MAG: DUF2279 domain-containing protein [Ignavibacteriales bacterium]|nr:DUF2279 domain-containing protein [Ignavibacteriales bacterium]
MKKIILLFSTVMCLVSALSSQEIQRDSMFIGLPRKDVATVITVAWSAAALAVEFEWWWKEDYLYKTHAFRMQSDGYFNNYSYGVDKLGHFYSSYIIYHVTYDFMKWANIDEDAALWTAIALPAAHAIGIEVGDGFSKWAFNMSDLYFNTAGLAYGVLQTKYPYLNNFNVKWSYFPSPSGGKNDPDWGPASDYSGHIYWVSMDMHNILPEPVSRYWPKELNLAVGLGAKNVSFGDTGIKQHKYAIGLDWNTTAILPDGDTWQIFKNLINKLKFPAPGVKFYSSDKPEGHIFLLN